MQVILYQPQIPPNTGNIVRTCAVTGCSLTLVQPLGFSIQDRWLKRAGLDYWEGVEVNLIDDLIAFLAATDRPFTCFSSHGKKRYSDVKYQSNHILIFGSETSGLPEALWQKWPDSFATLPMVEGPRCLNLATSVGISVYEAWRQQDFVGVR